MSFEMTFKAFGLKRMTSRLIKRNKNFGKLMQVLMGKHLDETRVQAGKLMIPNITGTPNPSRARKLQPSKAGKLTVRTGKMRYLLNYDADGEGYSGLGKIFYKKKSPALIMRVKDIKKGRARHRKFEGTIQVKVSSIPAKVSTTGGGKRTMPLENNKTIRARFLHELKGRKILEPAQRKLKSALEKEIKIALNSAYSGEL